MRNDPISNIDQSMDVLTPIAVEQGEKSVNRSISIRRRLRIWLRHFIVRQIALLSVISLVIARTIGRRSKSTNDGECEILLTGRFDSDNWIIAFLEPFSASKHCSRLWMVSTNPVPAIPKVAVIYPPQWLMKTSGLVPARLLTFAWVAIRKRPYIVGGFHIMVNGIVAVIVGRLVGARSMYFCVGGPAEVCNGGVHLANSYFEKKETDNTVVESRLLKVVAASDMIITMGSRALKFFRDKGIDTDIHVVSGGIDPKRFQPTTKGITTIDLIMTGRIVPVKRIDIFLQALKIVMDKLPEVRAVVVGEGVLLNNLQQLAVDLGIDNNVNLLGYQDDLISWLQKSKIFVLTSDSEGLSLSMMEAMMCGLPAVVSNVGDLGDLVEDGINGYLVPRRSPELFAERIIELLTDAEKLKAFSLAAHSSALRYTTEAATAKWDHIIESYRTS